MLLVVLFERLSSTIAVSVWWPVRRSVLRPALFEYVFGTPPARGGSSWQADSESLSQGRIDGRLCAVRRHEANGGGGRWAGVERQGGLSLATHPILRAFGLLPQIWPPQVSAPTRVGLCESHRCSSDTVPGLVGSRRTRPFPARKSTKVGDETRRHSYGAMRRMARQHLCV